MGRVKGTKCERRRLGGLIWMRTGLWVLATFVVSLVVFSSPITSAQIDFPNPNYEVLFKNNLRRGFLNLAGKKIGDKGLLILLQQDFLKDLLIYFLTLYTKNLDLHE